MPQKLDPCWAGTERQNLTRTSLAGELELAPGRWPKALWCDHVRTGHWSAVQTSPKAARAIRCRNYPGQLAEIGPTAPRPCRVHLGRVARFCQCAGGRGVLACPDDNGRRRASMCCCLGGTKERADGCGSGGVYFDPAEKRGNSSCGANAGGHSLPLVNTRYLSAQMLNWLENDFVAGPCTTSRPISHGRAAGSGPDSGIVSQIAYTAAGSGNMIFATWPARWP